MESKLPDDRREFESLLGRIFDEGGSEEDRHRLRELVTEHAELRAQYIEWMRLHAHLAWRFMPGKPLSVDELWRHSAVEAVTCGDEAPSSPLPPGEGPGVRAVFDAASARLRSVPCQGKGPDASPFPTRNSASSGRVVGSLRFLASLAALVLAAIGISWLAHRGAGHQDVAENSQPSDKPSGAAIEVAKLVRTYDCVWPEPANAPADGDRLLAGQELSLRSGLAEIEFSTGARAILQGPAQLKLQTALSAQLTTGKITVTADDDRAKGFSVQAPGMEAIDLGTEFGLEASPKGLEQVHVFRGAVDVKASPARGPVAASRRLIADQGMEVNLNTQGVKLVANNGGRFVRSLDEAQKYRHVVAYWRFDDHPVGDLVPESHKGTSPVRGCLDWSLNGNDLYTWSNDTQPQFSAEVPAAVVPRTGETNSASLNNSVPPAGHVASRDLFTMSKWSQPPGTDLQTITPAAWTVEASVKPAKLNDKYNQTFVVRDGMKADAIDPGLAPFVLLLNTEKHFVVRYSDVEKRSHRATATGLTVRENHWYHVAVTSDGTNLKLYVDSLDGKGYVLWAVTGLPGKGSTALGRGEFPPDSDPASKRSGLGYPYIWSVGRGYYKGYVGDWFRGWIDEVRICDAALSPSEFLFAPRAGPSVVERAADADGRL